GDVIVSRINPRIPRVLVVPDLGKPLLCSWEFEVLTPIAGVSPYTLAYLLLSPDAQQQLHSLTSGTSASHSRIKPGQVPGVELPWPSAKEVQQFKSATEAYANANKQLVAAMLELVRLRDLTISPHIHGEKAA